MKYALDLAVAAESGTLTLFLGAGFSKHLTDGSAPSWLELLSDCALEIEQKVPGIAEELFEYGGDGKVKACNLDLLVAAQQLEVAAWRAGKDIRRVAAEAISLRVNKSTINSKLVAEAQQFFASLPSVNVITTNYDTILTDFVLGSRARVFIEGTVARQMNSGVNVFHVHGCVSRPQSMVLTLSDYFQFLHRETYLSRKLHTLLRETTVAILGYSLSDFNLNSILNEAQGTRPESLRRADIFQISRAVAEETQKLSHRVVFGVEVVEGVSVSQFFRGVGSAQTEAKQLLGNVDKLTSILAGTMKYTDEFLKLRVALSKTFLRASVLGVSPDDARMTKLLAIMLAKKQAFTGQDGAWDQYTQLAEWLVEIGARVDITAVGIEDAYLAAISHSLDTMSSTLTLGKAWEAYAVWKSRAHELCRPTWERVRTYVADEGYGKATRALFALD